LHLGDGHRALSSRKETPVRLQIVSVSTPQMTGAILSEVKCEITTQLVMDPAGVKHEETDIL